MQRGRLWLNLTHIERNSKPFGALIQQLYEHLGQHRPLLESPRGTHSALLISSPGAQVYYHLDAEPNMLWHMRGRKEVWMYPAMDLSLVPQEYLEDIYAGEIGENLPYFPGFDASEGMVPSIKRMTYRVANKIKPFKRHSRSAGYITRLQLDPDSPNGLRELDEPRLASFADASAIAASARGSVNASTSAALRPLNEA